MRYAMFSSEPMSFTATKSNSAVSRISFNVARPIRPRPLIATFTVIFFPPLYRNLDGPRIDFSAGDGPAPTVAARDLTTRVRPLSRGETLGLMGVDVAQSRAFTGPL